MGMFAFWVHYERMAGNWDNNKSTAMLAVLSEYSDDFKLCAAVDRIAF